MNDFDKAFEITIKHEGGYTYHKDDKGGETNWGITKEVAESNGYKDDMKDLTIETAKEIYKKDYWDKLKLDNVESQVIANEVFDTGINMGTGIAGEFLQRTLNLLNRNEKNYENLEVDGLIGNKTISVLTEALKKDESYILKTLNIMQGARYIIICENNEKQEIFYRGWLKRVEIKDI